MKDEVDVQLLTLGDLRVTGTTLTRAKPLLLLAYLVLQGGAARSHLAGLFFPDVRDARDSLSTALGKLRRAGIPVEATGDHLTCSLACDAARLREAALQGQHDEVCRLYTGAFLGDLELDWGEELEEWVLTTREELARTYREAALQLAEQAARRGDYEAGARQAALVVDLPHAPPLDPRDLRRCHLLLQAGGHLQAEPLRAEAASLGIALTPDTYAAQRQLGRFLLGRDEVLRTLRSLPPGTWAWIYGGAGTGKTALLETLASPVLPGRPLPLGTLGPVLEGHEHDPLPRLGQLDWLLIDGWEHVDAESRRWLSQLRLTRLPPRVVLTSRHPPTLEVQHVLELGPLSAEALAAHSGLWEETGGLPLLVAARLAGEAPEQALTTLLSAFSALEREVYGALVLLPDPVVVRRALDLSGERFGQVLEALVRAGLVHAGGEVRARPTARRYLAALGQDTEELALRIARRAPEADALNLYWQARLLWEEPDRLHFAALSAREGERLLRAGRVNEATDLLSRAPQTPGVQALLTLALERSGQYAQAAEILVRLQAPLHALRASVAYRQGQLQTAQSEAVKALQGSPEERAVGLHVLGNLALDAGKLEQAATQLRAAAALYLMTGDGVRRGEALISLAIVRAELGEDAEAAFRDVLEASEHDPVLRTRVLINLGRIYEHRGDANAAMGFFQLALELTAQTGALDSAARLWNNIGALHHKSGETAQASAAYHHALDAARQTGELLVQANVLANLGTLHGDVGAMEEAIRLLELAGHPALAERHRARLEALRRP